MREIAPMTIIPQNATDEARKSAEEMDEQRHKTVAYEYLCHLEEAKKWLEACLREKLPATLDLEENLRNGVYLAKLCHFIAPDVLPYNKIYDPEQKRYAVAGLQFRHTDNINHFIKCLKSMQLPLTFQPETTDIYDKKNMPRVIYCIHALSTHLFKMGMAPQIQDLYGKVNFTDEEINVMSKELKKFGLPMPAFQKIGGLLTNEMPGNTAALHAAVIAINQALDAEVENAMLGTLQNSAARLKNIDSRNVQRYRESLSKAKELKTQAAQNRSLNDSYVPDAYDELLTQAEIQGHINAVNVQCALEDVVASVHQGIGETLISALSVPALQLKNVINANAELYGKELLQLIETPEWKIKADEHQGCKDLVQRSVDIANGIADVSQRRTEAVQLLNQSLQNGDQRDLLNSLMNPNLGLAYYIDEFAAPLYYEEMKIDCIESKKELTYSDIIVSIKVLSSIAAVSKAVDTGNPELTYQALTHPETHIMLLDIENKVKYHRALAAARIEKQAVFVSENPLLTYVDIQECVDIVNQQCQEDNAVILILNELNDAVINNSRAGIINTLQNPLLKLRQPIPPADSSLYLKLFKKALDENHPDGSGLWLEDVNNVAQIVYDEVEEVQAACTFLSQVNIAIDENDAELTYDSLRSTGLNINPKYKEEYHKFLHNMKQHKLQNFFGPYVRHVTNRGNVAYMDMTQEKYTWDKPDGTLETYYISKTDIQDIIHKVEIDNRKKNLSRINEKAIVKLQSMIRGYLLRKKISDRFAKFHNNIDKIISIQRWWRRILQQKYSATILIRNANEENNPQQKHENIYDQCKKEEEKVIKIQALWRGRAARRALHSLLHLDKPPFSSVRNFLPILDFNAEDYDEDLQLQQIRTEVVQTIRHNQNLLQQLNDMDIKIGLLIQNRITLQDVVVHGKHLESLAKDKNTNRTRKNSFNEGSSHKGLKSLTKEGRKMLEGYQHLFYALQTNPTYLSKLLFLLPQSKTNKFLQNVILTLFNFGSNMREEYLLLKLFRSALQEEIRSKFEKPSEVVTGDPLVLKMVVTYARQLSGKNPLRQIVGPIIQKILADKKINIETNPVDIYKCWRNQLEMETGQTLNLPYTVTQQEALTYEQVRHRLDKGITLLKSTVMEFLTTITESRKLIPFGMLYMAKVLNDTLTEKFPNAAEKDILKVVGNLVYYHFINAAIVAPDAFDIITLPVDRSLSNDQRRNLASIAKILQFAASKKGFGEEAMHLVCLNPFIIECHEKFKKFFRYCCQIDELEEHFRIHEFTEATLIHKPDIYISLQEICDTHSLVVEYQYQIAPDPLDPLHELLDDLGQTPTVASLMGITDPICESNMIRLGKTEVCLILTNKFEVPDSNDSSLNKLFIKTKELLVSVLPFLKGDSLADALANNATPIEEKRYDKKSYLPSSVKTVHKSSSLNDCKAQLRAYLSKLELGGWVSRADGYQNIITAVAKDLCHKSKYRILRRTELQTLRATKQSLDQKTKYYEEQVQFYNEYIHRCLENLNTGKGSLHAYKTIQKNNHGKLKSKMTLKYSAAKLQEKGVLLEVDGLPHSQFKNVIFEISPTEHNGIFTVRGKFMGVEMEKVDVDIQKLLQLQFEGAPIMDMFGKAKINVNLLLFLLNRKFYGKT
ncbi:ras GTPase-activating-like protein IQGAP1 [Neodiprion fabricii]|uniref:ras GTPase-activating-like protein IQGAP1 n=1 Tax=Neodiprion fabricii TaxID=2872261 RepID=UPI001ED9276C|nr:ras GTPase-activating-like protein IQGAP1 [Neodiprion fabricii]